MKITTTTTLLTRNDDPIRIRIRMRGRIQIRWNFAPEPLAICACLRIRSAISIARFRSDRRSSRIAISPAADARRRLSITARSADETETGAGNEQVRHFRRMAASRTRLRLDANLLQRHLLSVGASRYQTRPANGARFLPDGAPAVGPPPPPPPFIYVTNERPIASCRLRPEPSVVNDLGGYKCVYLSATAEAADGNEIGRIKLSSAAAWHHLTAAAGVGQKWKREQKQSEIHR